MVPMLQCGLFRSNFAFAIFSLFYFENRAARPHASAPIATKIELRQLRLHFIGDINSRRGQIQGTDSRGNTQVVEAIVPLANMFGYVNQLRSFTQGRAQYTMQFSHYDEVPQNVADEVKAKLA